MSQDELMDIVDSEGNFLQTLLKREAHEKGLLHKVVLSQVIDSRGRWLLVKPVAGRQDAGQYQSPMGGHVTAGETEEDAFKRETLEEIGLQEDFKYEFVGRKIFNRFVIGRQENHFFIMYKIFSDQEPVLSFEDESYTYFTKEELKKGLKETPELFGEAFRFVVESFFPDLLI
ncbi:MAG TPA: NUDIX hydrolase [Candidatus Paceibacterota bacterium]|jgi:isopentenyl-diphosphate delta-isomerase|nr:NUDIX hydrolase [Candidatus Paceibacterota bacterium]